MNAPPANFNEFYENESRRFDENEEFNLTFDQLPYVSQDEIFDIIDQNTSS